MSRRPHHGVVSQSATTNSASRKVRNTVPKCACMPVITVSTTSRPTRHRNTFGRTLTLGFTVSSTRIAKGRAPCAIPLPNLDGMCRRETPATKVRVLRYSSPQAALTLRRIERSRASAGSSGTAPRKRPGRRRSAVTDELIGLRSQERPTRRGPSPCRHGQDRPLRPSPCHLALLATCCSRPESLYESAERVMMIRRRPSQADRAWILVIIGSSRPMVTRTPWDVSGSCRRDSCASRVR